MNYKILIVDDEPANLRMLERLFGADYDVVTAESGPQALELLGLHDIALIISDQRMPVMTGIEFLKRAAKLRPYTVRVILTGYTDVSDLVEAINSGVVYRYITKPWVNTDLQLTVQRAIEHYEATKGHHLLIQENERLENRLQSTLQGLMNAVREIIAQKSPNLAEHCRRTSNYAALIGEHFGLKPIDIRNLIYAALLHELPNIRVPFEMTFKKASLTDEQYRVTRNSYEKGLRLISAVPELQEVANIICYQHERYNGTGFFDGLAGEKIPFNSRILAVANAFDELSTGHSAALMSAHDKIDDWLRKLAGVDLDPRIVDACIKIRMVEQIGYAKPVRSGEQVNAGSTVI